MSGKNSISSAELTKQKSEAQKRLGELRQQQVDDIEAGAEFQHSSEISLIGERLSALDAAITRAEERESTAEASAALQRDRQQAIAIVETARSNEDRRLEPLARAERAAKELIEALSEFATHSAEQSRHLESAISFYNRQPVDRQRNGSDAYAHSMQRTIGELAAGNVYDRMGGYLAQVLSKLGAPRLGELSWTPRQASGNAPWADQERTALRGRVEDELVRNMEFIVAGIAEGSADAAE